LGAHGLWQLLRGALNRARRQVLHLPPLSPAALVRRVHRLDQSVVYGYSRHLAPLPPAAAPGLAVTGFWFLPRPPQWQPEPSLVDFLDAGPPPVYIGFGSTLTGRTPDQLTALYVEALQRTNQRGLFFGGWGDFANIALPHTTLRVESIPHDWLFGRVAAVVHHGGAGSTSAAVAAGVPSVAMPFLGDQFYWARQLHALSCGPAPLVRQTLTAENLAATIADLVTNRAYRSNAQSLGAKLQAEQGAATAAGWIEHKLAQPYPGSAQVHGAGMPQDDGARPAPSTPRQDDTHPDPRTAHDYLACRDPAAPSRRRPT
jgi:sterol 3beta-glucosyltransferase